MSYTIVASIVNNLSFLLLSEANFLLGVGDQVKSLRRELEYMKHFLIGVDGMHLHYNDMVFVDQIREVACEAEDIVDTYVVDVAKEKRRNMVKKIFLSLNKAKMLHNLGGQVMQLQTITKQIDENRGRYRVEEMDVNEGLQWLQRRRIDVETDDVIGFVEETETMVNQLVRGTQELSVISISGMGGLGKTTLAKKVYRDPSVINHFRYRAWITVSHKLNLKGVLQKILTEFNQQIRDEISELTEDQLREKLKKLLSHPSWFSSHLYLRYLVVLDDIWNSEDWDQLKKIFPNVKNGSRVVVTTRNKQVGHRAKGNPPLELRFLNPTESWELFRRKVFQQEPCPTGLEPFGRRIVAKCRGLPLAIELLGGFLGSQDKTYEAWEKMISHVRWNLERETVCLDILGLSYSHLSPELRSCFLYIGLFPEDCEIHARQLIQLWTSEGFIQHNEDDMELKKEDVGHIYLQRLIDRSLIQVEKRNSEGRIKTCRVHDLIHGLCLKLSMKEKFLEAHNSVPLQLTKPRRLSIHCSHQHYISNADHNNICCIRTLLCFNQDNHQLSEKDWKSLFKYFKLLRVLDLGDSQVQMLPKAIEKLTLLKYLRVKTADIPSSLCALHSLQTLDLRWSQIHQLPKEIWSMQQLRHLYLGGHTSLPKNTDKKCLFHLQTLCYVSPTKEVDIAKSAPNLRKLGLYDYHCSSSDEQESTFKLPHLECLKLANECTFDVPIELPPSIFKIHIKTPNLQPETIQKFSGLSRLRILKLDVQAFNNNELDFADDCFPMLRLLKIKNSSIERLELGLAAVPSLKQVVISNCPGLTRLHIPDGVEVVTLPAAS